MKLQHKLKNFKKTRKTSKFLFFNSIFKKWFKMIMDDQYTTEWTTCKCSLKHTCTGVTHQPTW